MIKLLANCSNTGNYEYSDDDIKKIFSAIDSELKNAKAQFSKQSTKNKKFSL